MKTTFTNIVVLIAAWMVLLFPAPAQGQFQRVFGSALNESFSKVIQSGTDYYVLGQAETVAGQPSRATISRLSISGTLLWTRSLNIASQWNDAILTPSGSLLVVGHTLPLDANNQSIMGLITPTGTFSWVRSWNVAGRESFNRITRNPVPDNANFPFYVLGFQNNPAGGPNFDDVVLLTLSDSGNLGWKKIYSGVLGITDNEFVRDLEALPNGDLLYAGNSATFGVVFRANNAGEIFNASGPGDISFSFADVAPSGSNFYAVGSSFPGVMVQLIKFDADLIPQWQVGIPALSEVRQVWTSDGNIYVTGSAVVGGINRGVVLKLQDSGTSAILIWMKYLHLNETSFTGGTTSLLSPNQIGFSDGRVRPDGFGGFCAFLSVSDPELNTCITQTGMMSLVSTDNSFFSLVPPNIDFIDAISGMNITSSLQTWQQANACGLPCIADFTVTPLDNCGHVQVISTSTGQQPLSYQWCSGETSPILEAQLGCEPRTFCVSVTCADGSMSSSTQTVNFADDEPPVISCPSSQVVYPTSLDSCSVQVNDLQLLSATDNCAVHINYVVTGATTGSGQNDASGLVFNEGVSTVTYTVTDDCGNVATCSFTVTVVCENLCPGNIIHNPSFTSGATPGPMPSPGTLSDWQVGYGSPLVVTGLSCDGTGYVKLEGNKTSGSAIFQQLNTQIQKGKVYELSVCVRVASTSQVPYVKLRAVAFNNALSSAGSHPIPNPNVAIIDVSGRIPVCADWTTFVFHRWRAGNNFNNIAISVENSEPSFSGLMSIADIDNICFAEVNDSIPCYLAELDAQGNLIPPFGQLDPNCPPVDDDVDMYMGSINDIYGYCDSVNYGIDTWYNSCPDSCESIGGELPDELTDFIENDSLNQYLVDSLGINDSTLMSDLGNFLDSLELANPNTNLLDSLISLGAFSVDCRNLGQQGLPPNDPNSPFNGIDIVFVHGLNFEALEGKLNGLPGALTKWPTDRNEFYNGYWKREAYSYWKDHTERYLKTYVSPGNFSVTQTGNYSNRYLVVSHPTTQSFIYGTHSIMEQIANAMIAGTGVINCNPNETRPANTFGHNGFIIISHSDGAPLSDVVLTTSDLSRFPPLSLMLGDLSFIADRCELHVALQGAFGGSNYASLALMAVSAYQPIRPLIKKYLGFDVTGSLNWLYTSELLDMAITKHLWGPFMDKVPVCVLTLTGGHPTSYGLPNIGDEKFLSVLAKHAVHHGFDDGVLSMESQYASPYSRISYPNRYLPRPGKLTPFSPMLNEKLYDMGIHKSRSIRYYLDQKLDARVAEKISSPIIPSCFGVATRRLFAASGTVPWFSPTGMVQPVLSPFCYGFPGFDPIRKYHNHFSFLQSAADHFSGSVGAYPNYPDYDKTYETGVPNFTGAANFEESRVITSPFVYTKCGVNFPTMSRLQVEYVRGKSKSFRIFKKTYTFWIWKRKYHLLSGYEAKNQVDYLYETVLK